MLAPSDFSVLKNFVRKPIVLSILWKTCARKSLWFKITSNQLTVSDVICDIVFVNTANSLLMNFDCPMDTSSSKTARQHTQLVPRRTGSKPTAQISLPKTSGLQIHPTWTHWITMSGAMLEAYHKRHPKPKTIAELKEVLQVIWDSLSQGPIDKAVKEFSKRLKACVAAEGGHFEHSQ